MPGITESWRVTTREIDESLSATPSAGNIGATVLNAPKGGLEPIYVGQGQDKTIVNLFGTPNASYPQIWEAIEANKSAPIWMSAPSLNAEYGGVFVTKTGTVPFVSGQLSKAINFSAIGWKEEVGTGNDVLVNFTSTVTDFARYVNTSITVELDGVELASFGATDAEPEVITATELTSGTFTRATGVLDITFITAPTAGQVITVKYNADYSTEAYFALFNKNPEADSKAVKITKDDNNWFTINHYLKASNGTYSATEFAPYLVSLIADEKGDDGSNIDIAEVLEDDYYMSPLINTTLVMSTFADDTTNIDFAGGDRGETITATELALGWDYFKNNEKYAVDIFFDATADPSIPTVFDDLRDNQQKYKAYLLPLPNESAMDAITTFQGYSISNRGLYFYWNWAKVLNTYTNGKITTNLIGRVFQKHAAMVDVFNGLAPCWKDAGGHGGQLGGNILELTQFADEPTKKLLDDARINPIGYYATEGYMILSQRTSEKKQVDYSYIGHSRTADYLIANILTYAIPDQICKLNDNFHRIQVKNIADSIVKPLQGEPFNLLRDSLVICDSTNNTDLILSQRKFVLTVKIKVTPTSEIIDFNFVNTAQGTELS